MNALPSRADVVVIGGGAIGLSAAYALSRRGVSVVVLERHQLGSGASIGNACMVTPSHAERTAAPAALRDGLRYLFDGKAPLKLRGRPSELSWVARFVAASRSTTSANEGTVRLRALAVRSTMLHQEWSERLGTGLVMKGTLILWSGPGAAAARATLVAEQRAAGFTIQELDAAAIAMLEPSVRNATHGALSTDDGHVDSAIFIERLAEGIRAEGGTIIEGVDVLEIDRSGATVRLETTRGVLECERVVVAAGVWSRRFADELETSLPITPAKGYHVEFAGAATDVQRPIYFSEAHCVATPLAGRLRIAGTLEIGTDPRHHRPPTRAGLARGSAAQPRRNPRPAIEHLDGTTAAQRRQHAADRPTRARRPRDHRYRSRHARYHPRSRHGRAGSGLRDDCEHGR